MHAINEMSFKFHPVNIKVVLSEVYIMLLISEFFICRISGGSRCLGGLPHRVSDASLVGKPWSGKK